MGLVPMAQPAPAAVQKENWAKVTGEAELEVRGSEREKRYLREKGAMAEAVTVTSARM